ncbi:MAG: hypothetical protein RBU37_16245 [Myxococcota bacterium]|jgi:hypothetical protein|nr:hypothetical protein [Myxococcota bacterium]
MRSSDALLSRFWRASVKRLSSLLTRLAASLVALLFGSSMVLLGTVLTLVGVLLIQQSLSKMLRFELSFQRALGLLSRGFELLSHAA